MLERMIMASSTAKVLKRNALVMRRGIMAIPTQKEHMMTMICMVGSVAE
jgi:hypothetical protein